MLGTDQGYNQSPGAEADGEGGCCIMFRLNRTNDRVLYSDPGNNQYQVFCVWDHEFFSIHLN